MSDYSWVLKIKSIPDMQSVKRVNRLEVINTTKYGTLYGIKYIVYDGKSPRMIRFTSKTKDFKELFSIDIFNKKGIPSGFHGVFINKPDLILKVIGKIVRGLNILKKPSQLKEANNEFEVPMGEMAKITLMSFAPLLVLLMVQGIFWLIEWYKVYKIEKLEQTINTSLFETQKENEPAYAIYGKLISYIKNVISGPAPALIICGPPGTSKTYIVRRTLHFQGFKSPQDYSIAKGSTIGLNDTYYLLYMNRNKILILDDFDTPLKNEDMVNFLKSVTDSYKHRILSMPREKSIDTSSATYHVPSKFEFRGKLVIITNLLKKDIDRALLSRAPVVEVKFNSTQVLKALTDMMKFISPSVPMEIKEEVFDYIIHLYKIDPAININFRGFQNAIDARTAMPDHWKEMTRNIVEFD